MRLRDWVDARLETLMSRLTDLRTLRRDLQTNSVFQRYMNTRGKKSKLQILNVWRCTFAKHGCHWHVHGTARLGRGEGHCFRVLAILFLELSDETSLKNVSNGGGRSEVSGKSVFRRWSETGICWSRLAGYTGSGRNRMEAGGDG